MRKTLGYLPQEFGVYPKVSAEELLDHFALLKGIAERARAQGGRRGAAPADEPVGRAQAEAGRLLGRHAPVRAGHRPAPPPDQLGDGRRQRQGRSELHPPANIGPEGLAGGVHGPHLAIDKHRETR